MATTLRCRQFQAKRWALRRKRAGDVNRIFGCKKLQVWGRTMEASCSLCRMTAFASAAAARSASLPEWRARRATRCGKRRRSVCLVAVLKLAAPGAGSSGGRKGRFVRSSAEQAACIAFVYRRGAVRAPRHGVHGAAVMRGSTVRPLKELYATTVLRQPASARGFGERPRAAPAICRQLRVVFIVRMSRRAITAHFTSIQER